MATNELPDAEYFRQRIACDPESGSLTFLSRPVEDFPSERIWKGWNRRQVGKAAFNQRASHGYLTGRMGGVNYYAHRIIWLIAHGEWPDEIDHINGNRSDNRIANLRDGSHAQNLTNLKRNKRNRSGVSGVHRHSGAWIAKLGAKRLGRFKTKEAATIARRTAAQEAGYYVAA